ncbi:MAG: CCA tRNA nucleotidyltransferase [Solirubrobacterales bacterium]|nr:CCA tRNA nucleotidyltransferase [Solirubrobacterales bacterium]
MRTPSEALDALRATPCGAAALDLPAWLVGGVVRDLLLGRAWKDVDLVVEGEAETVVGDLGTVVAEHGRFGTWEVRRGDCAYNVVRARAESYAAPGALPDVRPGTLEDDLARRDFTVNAIALRAAGGEGGGPEGAPAAGTGLALRGGTPAVLRSVPGALDDLAARRLRVLHDRSFRDDPTRLWRLVRYAVRLGFLPDERTSELAAEAVAAGALETVSGDRLGAELRLALREPDPLAVLHAAQNLGLVRGLDLDPARVARALDLLPPDGRPDLALLGAVIPGAAWARGWGFTAAEEHVLARAAELAPLSADRPSAVAERLRGEPVEAVAVAGARGDGEVAERYLLQWRRVGLEITGHDLLEAGVPQGPEVGERLRRVLALRLDGELAPGREAELRAALD